MKKNTYEELVNRFSGTLTRYEAFRDDMDANLAVERTKEIMQIAQSKGIEIGSLPRNRELATYNPHQLETLEKLADKVAKDLVHEKYLAEKPALKKFLDKQKEGKEENLKVR